MNTYTKKLATNSLPNMEAAAATLEQKNERTPRSKASSSPTQDSPRTCYGLRYGCNNGKPFARCEPFTFDGENLPDEISAHTPGGWMNVDFFRDIMTALEKLEDAKRIIARYAH